MMMFLVTVIILIGIASLIGTIYAGKQVNNTIKNVENAKPEEQEQLLKANYYKSYKSNIGLMTGIYVALIVVLLAIGVGAYYLFQ
ncbi:MAG: hypothetical protein ACO1OC_09715 [Tuberibacillus sp.]